MSARTILNPPLVNELNGLFNGSSSITVDNLQAVNVVATGTITANEEVVSKAVQCGVGSSTGDVILQVGLPQGPYANFYIANDANNFFTSTAGISAPSFAGGLWGGTVNFSNPLSIGGAGVTGFSFTLPVVPPAGSTLSNIAFSFSPIATTSQSEFVTSYNVAYNTGDAFCTIYLYIYQPVSVSSELAAVRYIAYNGTTSTTTLTLLT